MLFSDVQVEPDVSVSNSSSGQQHVDAVVPACDKLPDPSLQARINRHLPKLVRVIEPDYGLLEELLSMDLLDEMEIAKVRGGTDIFEQNRRLLEYLKNKSDDVCQQFLTALTNCKQCHVVNYIEHDGS